MSYIDTLDHEFVGYFGGLPVYHPLEVIQADSDHPRGFGCGPDNLVIGGGPGEHPGLVVKESGETVNCFVQTWLRWFAWQQPEDLESIRPLVEAWPDASSELETSDYWRRIFELAGWHAEEHAAFCDLCESWAFIRPFRKDEDGCFASWLAASVGEFILLAMPELAPDAIGRLSDLRRHIPGGNYGNLLLAPPGYAVWGRREVNGQVKWGVSAWQIQRTHHPRTIREE